MGKKREKGEKDPDSSYYKYNIESNMHESSNEVKVDF